VAEEEEEAVAGRAGVRAEAEAEGGAEAGVVWCGGAVARRVMWAGAEVAGDAAASYCGPGEVRREGIGSREKGGRLPAPGTADGGPLIVIGERMPETVWPTGAPPVDDAAGLDGRTVTLPPQPN